MILCSHCSSACSNNIFVCFTGVYVIQNKRNHRFSLHAIPWLHYHDMLHIKRSVHIPGIHMLNNAKSNCYGNITFTGKHGGHIIIGSISPTFERLVEGMTFLWCLVLSIRFPVKTC